MFRPLCSPELPFLVLGLLFLKEAILFCMVGLPLLGKEGSGTPVFKILVIALHVESLDKPCDVNKHFQSLAW